MNKKHLVDFNPVEKKAVAGISLIVGFRMLGLFMLLPVLTLYAASFSGATSFLIGVAIGIYGFTQALLQVPFGMASDRIGRKKVITAGLALFALGSIFAALSESIYSLIAARALQGAGAVAAVGMALLADLTREEVRIRGMATVGISIGFSFMLAIIIGPLCADIFGVDGLFWFTAIFALTAIVVLYRIVPNPEKSSFHAEAELKIADLRKILINSELLRLDFGIFVLHSTLAAMFLTVPKMLSAHGITSLLQHGFIYFGILFFAVGFMIPMVIAAEAKDKMKPVFLSAVFLLLLAQLMFGFAGEGLWGLVTALLVYFTGFIVLESVLPSLISKTAPLTSRGTAMGVYSSSMFLGFFSGGSLGGLLVEASGSIYAVFILSAVLLLLWIFWSLSMGKPSRYGSLIINTGTIKHDELSAFTAELKNITGIKEVKLNPDKGLAYIRVDNKQLDRERLLKISANST